MYTDELVAQVARRTGLTKAKARDAVRALFGGRAERGGIIAAGLASGERVHVGEFGTFGTCRGFGSEPAGRPYFHPGRTLRQRLEGSGLLREVGSAEEDPAAS